MVAATQGNDKFIAHLSPQRPSLRKTQVVGIRRAPAANQARLLSHIADVVAVPNATRLWQRQRGFINCLSP